MRVPALTRVLAGALAGALAACAPGGARTGESAGEVQAGPVPARASVPTATDTGRSMEPADLPRAERGDTAAPRSAPPDSI
jgi:hypothetical protein